MQARSRVFVLLGAAGAIGAVITVAFLSQRSPQPEPESETVTSPTPVDPAAYESVATLAAPATGAMSAMSGVAVADSTLAADVADEPCASPELARGQYAFAQRDWATCVQHLQQAAVNDSGCFQAHYLLGLALHRLEHFEESNTAFESALAIAPRDARALVNSARTLLDLDRAADAHARAQQAVENAPDYGDTWNVLGRTHLALGRTAEAEAAFERACTLDSNAAWPRNNLGLLRLQRGAWQEAATQFEAAIARDDGVALFHHNLGAAYERCGRAADAAAQYARTLELQPEHVMAQIGLARVKGAAATAQVATAGQPDSTANGIQPQP